MALARPLKEILLARGGTAGEQDLLEVTIDLVRERLAHDAAHTCVEASGGLSRRSVLLLVRRCRLVFHVSRLLCVITDNR